MKIRCIWALSTAANRQPKTRAFTPAGPTTTTFPLWQRSSGGNAAASAALPCGGPVRRGGGAAELTSFPDQMIFVIDHIIEALRADTLMLRFLERSFVWPGLDQIEASGEAEPLMRKVLQIVMCSPEMAGRTEREIYQRITALGSMCISVCYTSVLEGKPDNIDNMKPILYDIIRRAL